MTFENLKWTRESKEYSVQPERIEISTMGRNPKYPNSQAVINLSPLTGGAFLYQKKLTQKLTPAPKNSHQAGITSYNKKEQAKTASHWAARVSGR